jgi:hypothetical protein
MVERGEVYVLLLERAQDQEPPPLKQPLPAAVTLLHRAYLEEYRPSS